MSNLIQSVRQWFSAKEPLPAGIYHYIAPPDDPRNYRMHLRLESDGSGMLVVNAATVLHLNQTAAEYAYHLVQNTPIDQAARQVSSRYQVSFEQAQRDYLDLIERIQTLVNTPDLDPVTFLDFDRRQPFSASISAPYRLDCALTYRLPEEQSPESAPHERAKHELSSAEWKSILDRAQSLGIPQVVFTGGEATLRDDLVELVAYAEARELVSGLITNGTRLAEPEYLDELLRTGLDHVTIVLDPQNDLAWKALDIILPQDISTAVHLTVREKELEPVLGLIDRLRRSGVNKISLSASHPDLGQALQSARDYAAGQQFELVWNLPVPYSALNPVDMETGMREAQLGAGKYWMYIEPDGDVLPAQGLNQVLGNLLSDPWEKIWKR